MKKKLLLVINPHSGKGKIRNKLLDVVDIFVKDGWSVTVHITQSAGDGFDIVKNCGGHFQRIVASGGDGTLNEVIRGIMTIPEEQRPTIGYLPSGTVNDFASNMHIPKNSIRAAQNAISGMPFKCDVGKFNQKSFVYVAAFGAFTNVSYETPQQNKNALGQMAYFLEGIKQLHMLPSFKMDITLDGEEIRGEFILGMVSNSNRIAGFKTVKAQRAQLNDGLFEVLLVRKPNTLAELSDLGARLLKQDLTTEAVRIFRTSKAMFKSETEVQWTLDGEFGGTVNCADISVEKEAVSIII